MLNRFPIRWLLLVAGVVMSAAVSWRYIQSEINTAEAIERWKATNVQGVIRPIPIHDSVWIEDLTWIEVRDLVSDGKSVVLIPTGGIEQNGPYVVTGKHNYIVKAMSERIAGILGNALVAPVLGFVPEGAHIPPSGHMLYPGTIGLSQDTFEQVLYEICLSLKNHGFSDIVLLGDSGGNQSGQTAVVARFNSKWKRSGVHAHHLAEYYEYDKWGYTQLKDLGVLQFPDVQSAQRGDIHSDYYYESILAYLDPVLIRSEERVAIDEFKINQVSLLPLEQTQRVGNLLLEARAQHSANWIRKMISLP